MTQDEILVGRIVKAHGIKGEVSVEVLSDVPERFAQGARLRCGARDLVVHSSRMHQGRMLVMFAGVRDRNEAETLRGAQLTIDAASSPPPPDGSYYRHELIGCEVFDGGGARLGSVARIEETKANDLWVVARDDGEVLVPAVRDIVVSVDVAARKIVLDPPEGLF